MRAAATTRSLAGRERHDHWRRRRRHRGLHPQRVNYAVLDFGARSACGAPRASTRSPASSISSSPTGRCTVANDGNALFDTLFYLSRNPDVFHAGVERARPLQRLRLARRPRSECVLRHVGYLAVNKDVAAAGINPLDHYHTAGWHEGRDPSANFDTTLYLIHNPDVAAAGIDPLEHYLAVRLRRRPAGLSRRSGRTSPAASTRNTTCSTIRTWRRRGVDPLLHFNGVGWHEGRNPNAWFDTAGYLAHYTDVAAAGINPLQHYEKFGWNEGRDPSAGFDTLGYLAANPDVAAAERQSARPLPAVRHLRGPAAVTTASGIERRGGCVPPAVFSSQRRGALPLLQVRRACARASSATSECRRSASDCRSTANRFLFPRTRLKEANALARPGMAPGAGVAIVGDITWRRRATFSAPRALKFSSTMSRPLADQPRGRRSPRNAAGTRYFAAWAGTQGEAEVEGRLIDRDGIAGKWP